MNLTSKESVHAGSAVRSLVPCSDPAIILFLTYNFPAHYIYEWPLNSNMVIAIQCTSAPLPVTTGYIFSKSPAAMSLYINGSMNLKKNNQEVIAYVILPNHFHAILYFPQTGYDLNKIIGNAKRIIAYEIIDRLKKQAQNKLLDLLSAAVTETEKSKGQLHKVFEPSFDAKPIYNQKFFMQKFNYLHHNPVSGKRKLADDYTDYKHSSASF